MILFREQSEWEAWLETNHETSEGVWLKIAKTDSELESVTYLDALDVAICYGWIDGRKKGADEMTWLQHFTPRRKKGLWSKRNSQRAEALIAAGRMKEAGLREVERAKADGRWLGAYSPQSEIQVPADLLALLDTRPEALQFFEALDSRNRFAILHRLEVAKTPEARSRRLDAYVALLEKGEKLYP